MHMKVFKQIITDIYCRIDNANILNQYKINKYVIQYDYLLIKMNNRLR